MTRKLPYLPGEPVSSFKVRSTNHPMFTFNSAAGRYLVLCFFGSTSIERNMKAIQHMTARRDFFNDEKASFFGVSIDPEDESSGRAAQSIPGIRYFWDFSREVSRLYGAVEGEEGATITYLSFTLVLDPMLRVVAHIPLDDLEKHNAAFDQLVATLPDIEMHAGVPIHAPVLVVPRVFEPEFCKQLIDFYEAQGGTESGFMREIGGKTVGVLDKNFKRRKDVNFDFDPQHEPLRNAIRTRIGSRLIPEINKAFMQNITYMERYLIACYDSESQGFFAPHRDNTTAGTAHRQFACTINLNAEEYEGGELRFPEFGRRTYRAPTGGAVIFSCALLHEATPVTRGTRYAYLPFLYDEAAKKVREENYKNLSAQTINANEGEDPYSTEMHSRIAQG